MQFTDRWLTNGAEHGRSGAIITPHGICVHYVGNPMSSAEANRNWFENGAGGARSSSHYIIGLNGEILRLIPENERAAHAGVSYAPQYNEMAKTNNSRYIGIECCHPDSGGQFNAKTYASLTALCADICARYNFNPAADIVRHYDITGKSCPLYYMKNPAAWKTLLSDIEMALKPVPAPVTQGMVKVNIGGVLYNVKAELVNDESWYLTFDEMGGVRAKLADILKSAGYIVTWDAAAATVMAKK